MSAISLTATAQLIGVAPAEMIARLGPADRNKAAAQNVTFLVQRHLTDFNRSHGNRLGGKRTNFYRQLAQSTNWSADEGGATVVISDFRASQTILGGLIQAGKNASFESGKPTAALTIPATAEAHGERAEKFRNKSTLIWFRSPHGKLLGMIVDSERQRLGKGKVRRNGAIFGGKLSESGAFTFKRVLYWLVSEVNQKGTPEAIPTNPEIVQGAVDGVGKLVKTVFARSKQATAVVYRGGQS